MGLTVYATGLSDNKSYDCGYITFNNFRMELARTFDERYGIYYKRWVGFDYDKSTYDKINLTDEDIEDWKKILQEKDPNSDFIYIPISF